MISFLVRLALSAATLFFLAQTFPDSFIVRSWTSAFIAALVLGLANALVKPVLLFVLKLLTLPLSCLTLGLWTLFLSWLLSAILFYVTASALQGFGVSGFGAAMWGALALSIVNALASALKSDKGEKE